MSISIVMPFYNRKALLINTLNTIANGTHPDEIVIVDDASDKDNRIEDLVGFRGLNIVVHRIDPKEKTWVNPCIPFNKGFEIATGNIIIIQNPECLHVNDVVGHAVKNTKDGEYTAFGCYSIDMENLFKIQEMDLKTPDARMDIHAVIQPLNNARPHNDCQNGWYCHSQFNPCALHFCSAITKKDLDILGGFDERYANGIGYDDTNFIARVRARMKVKMVDYPFVIHQAHRPTDYVGNQKLFARNQTLYHTGKLK